MADAFGRSGWSTRYWSPGLSASPVIKDEHRSFCTANTGCEAGPFFLAPSGG